MNTKILRVGLVCIAVHVSAEASSAGNGPCDVLEQYIASRQTVSQMSPAQRRDESLEWLARLVAVVDNAGCGGGVDSARWHAMALANSLEEWSVALDLARVGLLHAVDPADKALWQMNIAGATFHNRDLAEPVSVRAAISEIDSFLSLAPGMGAAERPGDPPKWLLPVVNALVWKASCQRELEDHLGAALTEQRVATTYVAAGIPSDARYGGFLPEEAMARSCVDLARAGRAADAAGAISSIRNLPGLVRPAGQHAWNSIGELTDPDSAVNLAHELLAQMPHDEWMVLVCLDTASVVHNSPRDERRDRAALQLTEEVVFDAGALERADRCRAGARQAAGLPADVIPVSSRSRMLQARVRLAIDLNDRTTAAASINVLAARGELADWCQQMMQRLPPR